MILSILAIPIYKPIILEVVLKEGWVIVLLILIAIILFILISDK